MKFVATTASLAAVCGLALLASGPVPAQFGVNLPQSDFSWTWGNRNRAEAARSPDITMRGADSGFDCLLQARLRASSRWSFQAQRALEQEIRTYMSFIESAAYHMNLLDRQFDLDWARLDCTRLIGSGAGGEPDGAQMLSPWIELEVGLYQDFAAPAGRDGGHWQASYRQAQSWRLRASRSGARGTYSIRPEGLLLPSALADIEASAQQLCYDSTGNAWHTEWSGPAEPLPVSLSATNEGGQLVLWASVPEVAMRHPGHAAVPADSACHTAGAPFVDYLRLDTGPLQGAGAVVDSNGAFRIASLSWDEVAAAADGSGEPVRFAMQHEATQDARRVAFSIRGTIAFNAERAGGTAGNAAGDDDEDKD
jgi:hypothetical protein